MIRLLAEEMENGNVGGIKRSPRTISWEITSIRHPLAPKVFRILRHSTAVNKTCHIVTVTFTSLTSGHLETGWII
ncbi:hypothetical protein SUGI_0433040 [Cryptomeria japonica]|nr:hypothetical protein SUGI_0433040 [Cryptomeria japonica]